MSKLQKQMDIEPVLIVEEKVPLFLLRKMGSAITPVDLVQDFEGLSQE